MFYVAKKAESVVVRYASQSPIEIPLEELDAFKEFCEVNKASLREALVAVWRFPMGNAQISFSQGIPNVDTWVFLAQDDVSHGGASLTTEDLEEFLQKLLSWPELELE